MELIRCKVRRAFHGARNSSLLLVVTAALAISQLQLRAEILRQVVSTLGTTAAGESTNVTERITDTETGDWIILHGSKPHGIESATKTEQLKPTDIIYGSCKTSQGFFSFYRSIEGWMPFKAPLPSIEINRKFFDDVKVKEITGIRNIDFEEPENNALQVILALDKIQTRVDDQTKRIYVDLNDEGKNATYSYDLDSEGNIANIVARKGDKIVELVRNERLEKYDIEAFRKSLNISSIRRRKIFYPVDYILKSAPGKIFGYKLQKQGDSVVVGRTFVNSSAAKAGLKPGIEILQIGDIPVDKFADISEIENSLKDKDSVEFVAVTEDGSVIHPKIERIEIGKIAVDGLLESDELVIEEPLK
jgi:hypothetical protein